jgi:hypothetical protein
LDAGLLRDAPQLSIKRDERATVAHCEIQERGVVRRESARDRPRDVHA